MQVTGTSSAIAVWWRETATTRRLPCPTCSIAVWWRVTATWRRLPTDAGERRFRSPQIGDPLEPPNQVPVRIAHVRTGAISFV
jgi:hypothetical protein